MRGRQEETETERIYNIERIRKIFVICAEEAVRPGLRGARRAGAKTRTNQSVEEKEMKKLGRILGLALLFCLLAGLTTAGALAEKKCKDGHTPGKKVKEEVVQATCEKDGSYEEVEYCKVCKKELSREKVTVKAKGHKWGEWKTWRKPTCTRPGERRRICERDPKHIDREEIEALGHLWNPWEVVTEATIDAPGSESRICRRDEEHVQTREIPQVGSVQITETKRMDLLELMEKIFQKKVLTRGEKFGILCKLAREGVRKGDGRERADRTLKTIQRRETRKKRPKGQEEKEDSEDSEEFRC